MSDLLTEEQAYRAMYFFLAAHWERTGSPDIAALLGDLSLLADGASADPAAIGDFKEAIAEARGSRPIDFKLAPS
jgi:hypothetical protein